jgi:FkbM family methyltransferase
MVGPGQTVVDVGASDGVFAERLARLVGLDGRVHAFEANPEDAKILDELRSRCPNVSVHIVGLSDHESTANLHIPVIEGRRHLGRASVAVPASREHMPHDSVAITLQRLDDVLADERGAVTFIKCDVEGHEDAVLRGADATLRASHPVLLLEIEQRHRDTDVTDTLDHVQELGYTGFGIVGQHLLPIAEFDLERDQLRYLGRMDAAPDDDAPDDYIHNFVFVPVGRDLSPKLSKRLRRTG